MEVWHKNCLILTQSGVSVASTLANYAAMRIVYPFEKHEFNGKFNSTCPADTCDG
jgi:hypothetical protein